MPAAANIESAAALGIGGYAVVGATLLYFAIRQLAIRRGWGLPVAGIAKHEGPDGPS
jgi:uncharacterized membrane protein YeiH